MYILYKNFRIYITLYLSCIGTVPDISLEKRKELVKEALGISLKEKVIFLTLSRLGYFCHI